MAQPFSLHLTHLAFHLQQQLVLLLIALIHVLQVSCELLLQLTNQTALFAFELINHIFSTAPPSRSLLFVLLLLVRQVVHCCSSLILGHLLLLV